MKFPVDKCETCGLDLATAAPTEVNYFDNRVATGTCPNCGRPYFMVEEAPEPVLEPEPAPVPTSKRRRASEPVVEPEPETPPEE